MWSFSRFANWISKFLFCFRKMILKTWLIWPGKLRDFLECLNFVSSSSSDLFLSVKQFSQQWDTAQTHTVAPHLLVFMRNNCHRIFISFETMKSLLFFAKGWDTFFIFWKKLSIALWQILFKDTQIFPIHLQQKDKGFEIS